MLKIKERKVPVSITIGEELLKDLNLYKKENNIKELSPMIDQILREWLKKEKEVKK